MTVCGSVTLVVGPPLCRQGSVPPFLLYWASPKPPIACLPPDTWGEIVRLGRSGSGKPQNARVIRGRRSQGMPRPLPWTPKPFLTPTPRKHSRTLVTWSLQCPGSASEIARAFIPSHLGGTQFSKHLLGSQAGQGDQSGWSQFWSSSSWLKYLKFLGFDPSPLLAFNTLKELQCPVQPAVGVPRATRALSLRARCQWSPASSCGA